MKTFEEWLKFGIENNWVSAPYCDTHDLHPFLTKEQEQEFEEGGDPCVLTLQLRADN